MRRDELVSRIEAASAERMAAEKALEKLDALPDFRGMPEGAVFAAVTRLGGRSFVTYIGFKTKGRFYLTGKTGPNAVSADELEDWFTRSGRTLVSFQNLAVVEVEVEHVIFGNAETAFDLAAALYGVGGLSRSPYGE
jgi:hypothetical protein